MVKKDVLTRVEEALEVLKKGQLIIVADDVEREGEGDMVGIAEHVTPENVNTMISHARGFARPKMGKTTLYSQLAVKCAKALCHIRGHAMNTVI